MSDLQYYTTDEFLNLYVKGDKCIDEMLSLDNLKHTTTYRISFLNHLLSLLFSLFQLFFLHFLVYLN